MENNETSICNCQDITFYYSGGCPICDPPRCPCCGRILGPYRVYPYYPPYIGDWPPYYPPWKENEPTWGTSTVIDYGNYQVWM